MKPKIGETATLEELPKPDGPLIRQMGGTLLGKFAIEVEPLSQQP